MNQYLELANEVEKMSDSDFMSLDKAASLWLLHSYLTNGSGVLKEANLVKHAAKLREEEDMALHLGIELALKAIMGGE